MSIRRRILLAVIVFLVFPFLLIGLGWGGLLISIMLGAVTAFSKKITAAGLNAFVWVLQHIFNKEVARAHKSKSQSGKNGPVLEYLRQYSIGLYSQHAASPHDTILQWVEAMNWRAISLKSGTPVPLHQHVGQLQAVLTATRGKRDSFIILGGAGAGKTSMLQRHIVQVLKDDALFKAETDGKPMIYLPLSSWDQDQSLRSWLSRELQAVYGQEKAIADQMAKEQDHITPVLDGLDQVPSEFQSQVLQEIYEYGVTTGNRIFVTCRPDEFYRLLPTLKASKNTPFDNYFCTLELECLLPQQISGAIIDPTVRADVNAFISGNKSLQTFASYPMGLRLLVQVFHSLNQDEKNLLQQANSTSEIFAKVWKKYEEFVFDDDDRRHPHARKELREIVGTIGTAILRLSPATIVQLFRTPYPREKTSQWLRHWRDTIKANFSLESIQPDMLTAEKDKRLYFILSRTLSAIALTLAVGCFLSGPVGYLGGGVVAGYSLLLPYYWRKKQARRANARPHWTRRIVHVALFFIPVGIILIAYFGFITPRMSKDMRFGGYFSVTEANLGFFILLFMGAIFVLRDGRLDEKNDVRLMNLARKNIRSFLLYGIVGSVLLGLTLLGSSWTVLTYFPHSLLSDWAHERNHGMDLMTLSLPAGVLFGFPLCGVLGLLQPKQMVATRAVYKVKMVSPRHILRSTFFNGISAGALIGVLSVFLFAFFFAWFTAGSVTSINKGIRAGIGTGILTMLWFGGFDLIHYYALKLVIAAKGYGPWDFTYFFEYTSRLRFTDRFGTAFLYYHPTLVAHFSTPAPASTGGIRTGKTARIMIPIILLTQLALVALPFYCRHYHATHFWKSPYGYTLDNRHMTSNLHWLNDTTAVVTGLDHDTDTLEITANGRVKAGEFTGYVTASGTEAGFVGFSIGNAFDLDAGHTSAFCHCSLLVKKQHDTTHWYSFPEESSCNPFSFDCKRRLRLTVTNGDTLHLMVNDREWHNNTGAFVVKIAMAPDVHTKIVAHRAGAALAPENTMLAIERSLQLGVDFIEIDIHQTRDNQLALMHDPSVDRMTDGSGKIADLTWAEIQALKIRHNGRDTLRVPNLAMVLDRLKDSSTTLLIEVKSPDDYRGIARNLLTLLREKNMLSKVIITSFDQAFLQNLEGDAHELRTALLLVSFFPWTGDIPDVDYVAISYVGMLFSSDALAAQKQAGKKILVWTVNSTDKMQHLVDAGVDGIITDCPDRLQRLIAQ
jgi:glycerophosphoryl diester phosphodiesterase